MKMREVPKRDAEFWTGVICDALAKHRSCKSDDERAALLRATLEIAASFLTAPAGSAEAEVTEEDLNLVDEVAEVMRAAGVAFVRGKKS